MTPPLIAPRWLDRPARLLLSIGECMIELADRQRGHIGLGFAGDTLNSCVYLARLCGPNTTVGYVTALGNDPYSDTMVARWQSEGIDIRGVSRLPDKLPGLYLIRTDSQGERSFFYFRNSSAARCLFDREETFPLLSLIDKADVLHFSGITLAILSGSARDRLAAALNRARQNGAKVVFDGNYRPALWPSVDEARQVYTRFLHLVDLALPSIDDENALFGPATAGEIADRIHTFGVPEIVVKQGADGCLVSVAGTQQTVTTPRRVTAIDTTGAGDSFNAGYLSGRLAGLSPTESALRGHHLAAAVIGHPGAIIPIEAMPAAALASSANAD